MKKKFWELVAAYRNHFEGFGIEQTEQELREEALRHMQRGQRPQQKRTIYRELAPLVWRNRAA